MSSLLGTFCRFDKAGSITMPPAPTAADFLWQPNDGPWPVATALDDRWHLGALAAAFDGPCREGAASIVVLDRGGLVIERHFGPAGSYQLDDVASVQKSVVAILVGIAASRGLLATADPVSRHLGAGWSRAPRRHEDAITIEHLLTMTSGLGTDLTAQDEGPGRSWQYNTPAYLQVKAALAAAAGEDLEALTRAWLAEPIGMSSTNWVAREPLALPADASPLTPAFLRDQGFAPDPDGRWAQRMPDGELVTALHTTARDLARFGLLIAADGRWGPRQVVPADWVRHIGSPSQSHNGSYGRLVWLNQRPGRTAGGEAIESVQPEAPPDLVAARGAGGQLVDVAPGAGLVLVRTALPPEPGTVASVAPAAELWRAVLAARHGVSP